MMKTVKNIKVWYAFMPRFTVPLWRLNGIFQILDFSANWIKQSSNLSDSRVAQAPGSFTLVDPLKTSSLDSVTAYLVH